MSEEHKNNPLHGITLKAMLESLVEHVGVPVFRVGRFGFNDGDHRGLDQFARYFRPDRFHRHRQAGDRGEGHGAGQRPLQFADVAHHALGDHVQHVFRPGTIDDGAG